MELRMRYADYTNMVHLDYRERSYTRPTFGPVKVTSKAASVNTYRQRSRYVAESKSQA